MKDPNLDAENDHGSVAESDQGSVAVPNRNVCSYSDVQGSGQIETGSDMNGITWKTTRLSISSSGSVAEDCDFSSNWIPQEWLGKIFFKKCKEPNAICPCFIIR